MKLGLLTFTLLASRCTSSVVVVDDDYRFDVTITLKRLCSSPNQPALCSLVQAQDVQLSRIADAMAGWKMFGKGQVLLPLLEPIAEDLIRFDAAELADLKQLIKAQDLAGAVRNLIHLLIQANSFQLAADLFAALQKDLQLGAFDFNRERGSQEFLALLVKRHPQALQTSEDAYEYPSWIHHDASGGLLQRYLSKNGMDRVYCKSVGDDKQHLKQLRRVLQAFVDKQSEDSFKAQALIDLCYAEDASKAEKYLKRIEASHDFYWKNHAWTHAGLRSNNFEISFAFVKKFVSSKTASFIGELEKSVSSAEFKSLWPFLVDAMFQTSLQLTSNLEHYEFLAAFLEKLLNSGRSKEFELSALLLSIKSINSHPTHHASFKVRLNRLEGFKTLFYSSKLMSALDTNPRIVFHVDGAVFASLVTEDVVKFKKTLRSSGMNFFFNSLYLFNKEEFLFTVPKKHEEFVAVLDVLLLKNDLLDVRAYTLEQLKRLLKDKKPVRAFVVAARPLIAFIRYWWGGEAIAQLPQEILSILPEFNL